PFHVFGDESRDVPVRSVRSKMETPVVYFYSSEARRVNLKVEFPNGLLTHWFPNADVTPRSELNVPLDVATIERSTMSATLDLTPEGDAMTEASAIPKVGPEEPWDFARQVHANYVRTSEGETERYFFYRGLGKVSLPV